MSDFEKAFNQLSKVNLENHTELWGEPKTERAFFEAGQASKQAEIDELQKRVDQLENQKQSARVLCETACELLDDYSHQDAMVILDDLEEALRGEHE